MAVTKTTQALLPLLFITLTTLTGAKANINTKGNTNIKGVLIASATTTKDGTADLLNELYNDKTAATTGRLMVDEDLFEAVTLVGGAAKGVATGVVKIGKAGVKAVDKSLTKGVDEALDIELKRPTINDNFLDSKPISRDQAKKLLEERYIKQGESPETAKRWAETTVDSFEGQITTRMVLEGDTFILNHSHKIKENPPTGIYVIKKENANKTPYELQKELALPKSNPATVQTEVTVTKPHEVLEGEVKGQADQNWAWDHATGGGQQTVVDPKSTNRDEVIGDKK